jgi:hypothetical protein
MEGGNFELVHNMKLSKASQAKGCEMCDAVREQIEQGHMCDVLKPPKPKKNKQGEEVPFKFELPLEKPMCDNTIKFSKWIKKKKPHLRNKILQCAAHLTGIAWQKRSHSGDAHKIYRRPDDLPKVRQAGGAVRCLRCSNTALAMVLHRKLVEWLRHRDDPRAAAWFEEHGRQRPSANDAKTVHAYNYYKG